MQNGTRGDRSDYIQKIFVLDIRSNAVQKHESRGCQDMDAVLISYGNLVVPRGALEV